MQGEVQMSWDIILEKPLPGTNVDLFDESSLEAFDLTAVQNCLRVICPHITETRPLWMVRSAKSFNVGHLILVGIIYSS